MVALKRLLEVGLHFGHATHRWNPKMRPFIHSERNGVHIIDLVQTQMALQRACDFAAVAAREKKNIVFIGTKRQAADIVEEEAKRCGVHYVNRRWLGGMLTNFDTMRLRINRLRELEEMRDTGDFYRRPKKELAVLNRELFKLEKSLGGLKNLKGSPDVLFVIDQRRESLAIAEAKKVGITVICLIDTNCDPDGIEFLIPGNDDSIQAARLVTRAIADAILFGKPKGLDDDAGGGPEPRPSGVPRVPSPSAGEMEAEATPDFLEHSSL